MNRFLVSISTPTKDGCSLSAAGGVYAADRAEAESTARREFGPGEYLAMRYISNDEKGRLPRRFSFKRSRYS